MHFCQIWSPANNAIFRPDGKMLGTLGTRNDDKCHDGRIGPLCSDKGSCMASGILLCRKTDPYPCAVFLTMSTLFSCHLL